MTPARAQFATDILTTAIEGGVNYWAQVLDYHWNDADPDKRRAVLIATDDPDRGELEVTLAKINTVLNRLKYTGIPFREACGKGTLHKAICTDGEDGDFDADDADAIIQLAVLGEIIYG
jgi:hypothetical protein